MAWNANDTLCRRRRCRGAPFVRTLQRLFTLSHKCLVTGKKRKTWKRQIVRQENFFVDSAECGLVRDHTIDPNDWRASPRQSPRLEYPRSQLEGAEKMVYVHRGDDVQEVR